MKKDYVEHTNFKFTHKESDLYQISLYFVSNKTKTLNQSFVNYIYRI